MILVFVIVRKLHAVFTDVMNHDFIRLKQVADGAVLLLDSLLINTLLLHEVIDLSQELLGRIFPAKVFPVQLGGSGTEE